MHPAPPMTPYSESLLVHPRRIDVLRREAVGFASVDLGRRQLCDLELLLTRAFYPLEGYLGREDYERVLDDMRLADGALWAMPVCLDVPEAVAQSLRPGVPLALRDSEGFMLAVLHVQDVWKPDKAREARALYGTDDPAAHDGVRRLYNEVGEWYVGGRVEGLHLPQHYDFPELRLSPADVHRAFAQRGWRRVVGFQMASWPHCAHHDMMLAAAREAEANIFIMLDVSPGRDRRAETFPLIRSYRKFLERFPRNMAALALLPYAGRGAGPREALWQAQIRGNYGCTHVLLQGQEQGQDDACAEGGLRPQSGGDDAAMELVQRYAEEAGVTPLAERPRCFVEGRGEYVPLDAVTEDMRVREISSRELWRRLEHGLEIPEWFLFPEVVEELRKAHPPRHKQGFTIFITGLSGAGKSTLAKVLLHKFLEMNGRPVTLLDGDIVRRNLSSELTFSREHRNLNVTRIGYVASEITKNRGIALCAPIAPYEESRQAARRLVRQYGGFVEVYMSTPLAVCEQRDRKGLYAKARAGRIAGVTGIDAPYEPPVKPDLAIDTTERTPKEAAHEVLRYLAVQGYIV